VDVFSDLNQGLALESGIFDTVLLTDVLEHIYSPGRLLSEIHRVLKKGGRAVIAVPFIYRIHEEPHDYFRYTEYALKRMCEEAGLRIIKLEPYGRYLDVLFDTLNKVFLRNRLLIKAVMPLTRILKRSFISRKINKAHQDKYALGYILSAEKI
jgi:SAM-dependent methyltransferase